MTTGALIFAINNETVDYVGLAAWNAANVRRHLKLPVAVVTDHVGDHAACFDHVITVPRPLDARQRDINLEGRATWYNTNRMDAYDLSPWTRTVVLDADYVVATDRLRVMIEHEIDFACYGRAYDVTARNDFAMLNTFGSFLMPMWWATVMIFNRSRTADLIFCCMRMVRDNWTHYRNLYGNRQALFRNDHALSIALGIETGHTLITQDIPWDLATVMPDCALQQLSQDHYRVEYQDGQGRARWIDCCDQDLHVMSKSQLGKIVANPA